LFDAGLSSSRSCLHLSRFSPNFPATGLLPKSILNYPQLHHERGFAMKQGSIGAVLLSMILIQTAFSQSPKMTVKDSDANVLMEVNDEGTAGSITVLSGSAPSVTTNKLYNSGGTLYWSGTALGTSASAGGWTDGGANVYTSTSSDKVGLGTSAPEFKLSLMDDGGIIAQGKHGEGDLLNTSGEGTRLIWYPLKSAFRAGYVNGTQWNNANIGDYSMALGFSTSANNDYSTATGSHTTASGLISTAMGSYTTASGEASTAMGASTTASGSHSTATGNGTVAGAYLCVAMGRYNVGGGAATSWVSTDPIFEIGIGADASNKANAVTVLKNGRVGIGTVSPQGPLDVNGAIYQRGAVLHADYVFEGDYQLESITEHADFMWRNKHLKAIPKMAVDEEGRQIVEVGAHQKGIVEELEKAHIYIQQLNESNQRLFKEIELLKEQNQDLEKRIAQIK
jgi:hypothetical protein